MQASQIIAWNGRIHVVLGVVIHLPVEKTHNRVQGEGAAAQAEILHEILEPDMLGVVAEKKKPSAVKRGEGDQDRDDPLSGG